MGRTGPRSSPEQRRSTMLNIPILRWGKPYESLEVDRSSTS